MIMATYSREGDDTYGSALQRVMHECLPPILAEIADKRPSDPIEYLANSLYKFREKEDQELNEREAEENHMTTHKMSSRYSKKNAETTQDNKLRQDFLSKGLIVEVAPPRGDDFIEEDLDAINMSNKMVHESCMSVIKQIGDIFDEDDLS